MSREICRLCGERESQEGVEVCSLCASDARLLEGAGDWIAPKAARQAREQAPDWAEV